MFLGRKKEIELLQEFFHQSSFQFLVIYGRRRVGKTALLSEFARTAEAKSVYFQAVESSSQQNLENFSQVIDQTLYGHSRQSVYNSFQAAFEEAFVWSEKEKLILIVDEYPYLARSEPSIPSVLQRLIDQNKDDSRLMLILCGSSMSYMEDEVLAYKSPLYGRRTGQMEIRPLDFFESLPFLDGFSDEEKGQIYGMTGGIPYYLLQFDASRSFKENVIHNFLREGSFFLEEPSNLLKQELRETAVYNSILSTLAHGLTRKSKIADKVKKDSTSLTYYLDRLMELQIVEREQAAYTTNGKKVIYRISDHMFQFWYRFIFPNLSYIAKGLPDLVWEEIEDGYAAYMGFVFEDICKQYLWKRRRENPFHVPFYEVNRWWGSDPQTKTSEEIDLVGQAKQTALVAECRWKNEPVDKQVLDTLLRRSRLIPAPVAACILFSRSAFSETCQQFAEDRSDVWLIQYKDMLKDFV